MSVPTNLIPTKITGLPEYTGTSQAGYFPYVLDGTTYKVQFSSVASSGEVPPSRTLTAGTGLTGGGDLSANRVFAIANGGVGADQLDTTGVVAGVYGNGSNVPTVTVDANGRVTSVTTSPVVATGYVPEGRLIIAGTGLSGGGSLADNVTLSVNLASATPQALGSATAGVSTAAAREDHVHPAVDLSDTNETQGALPLGRGGTGDALSPVAGAVVYSTGTKFALTNPGISGQVLTSTGTDEPVWTTITGTGTVTSVNASGGGTGMTFTGGPITTVGTLTLGGTLAIGSGGTGATTAGGARTNLGAAASGANSDITSLSGITGGISTADFVAFDTTYGTPPTLGQLAWNNDDGTLDVGLNGGAVLQVGQEQLFYAKNTSGGTIPLGTPVMFTGVVGASGKLTFGLAVANGTVPSEYMMGVTTQNVVNNDFGYVTTFGLVRGFNTSGVPYGQTWADGDLLYFDPATPGGWTNVEPAAPNIHVPVAVVINAATGGSGSIFVRMIQSQRIGELQDVEINGGGPAAGQVLIYDASQSRWENNTLTAGSNVTITNGNGSITIAASDQFTGTVTSVAASGGTTGLTFSGSPITNSGTLTLGGTLAIGSGGTGATTAGAARTALGAAASGANTDISSVALTSGTILNSPTSGTDIVNKAYADSIASGINFHQAVRLATVAALPAYTYNNGSSGVGATITANANGALNIDGVAVVAGNRVLIKDEVGGAQAYNGVYTVTQTGSGSTPFILTRATDFDSAGSGVDQIDAGDFFLVTAGSTLANTSWVQQTPLPITVGTTAIVFSQFGAPVLYSAGTGLTLAGTVFSITNTGVSANTYGSASQVPVLAVNAQGQITSASSTSISIAASQVTSGALAVARGGTALTATPTNGQLLIGNGTGYSLSTLTAGTGMSVTNGSGSVTVTNTAPDQIVTLTGGGATVVSGTYPNFTITSSAGTGTVTSVDVSGGTTGLSFTGGPITSSGTITMGGTLGVANGGTGTTTSTGSGSVVLSTSPTITTPTFSGAIGVNDAINYNGSSVFYIRSRLNGGTVQIGTETTGGTLYYPITINGTSDFMSFSNQAGEVMRLNSSGNVGIGTTAPQRILHLATAEPTVVLQTTSAAVDENRWRVRLSTAGDFAIGTMNDAFNAGQNAYVIDRSTGIAVENHIWYTAGSEVMRLNSSGNVGIGTNAPAEILHLSRDSALSFRMERTGASPSVGSLTNAGNLFTLSYNLTGITFNTGTSPAERMRVNSTGDVLVATTTTSSSSTLDGFYIAGSNSSLFSRRTSGAAQVHLTVINGGTTVGSIISSTTSTNFNTSSTSGITGVDANTVAFQTSSTERMRIDSSGNVGIGTSSPLGQLHVSAGNSGDCRLILQADADNNNEDDNPFLIFMHDGAIETSAVWSGNAGGGTNDNSLNLSNSTSVGGGIRLFTGTTDGGWASAAERMRVTNAGDVGIGTTSPATKLNVIGDIQLSRSTTASDAAINFGSNANNYIYGGNSSNIMAFAVNASERMRITSAGNVGIGTSSPGFLLHGVQNGNAEFRVSATNVGTNSAGLTVENEGNRNWNLWANRSTDVFIIGANSRANNFLVINGSSGNVGIGTSNIQARLHVDGGQFISDGFGDAEAGSASAVSIGVGDNDTGFFRPTFNVLGIATGGSERMRIDSSGNVGIGATLPGATGISPFVAIGANNAGIGSASANNIAIVTNNTERMRINSSGQVGIGTSSPGSTLDVTGRVRLGNGVTQVAPSATDIGSTAHTILSGTGGNALFFGQYPAAQTFAQWIQSSFTNPTTATYNIILQPLGGNVGIGVNTPSSLLHVKRGSNATEVYPAGTWATRVINATDTAGENGLLVGNRWAGTGSTAFEVGSIFGGGTGSWFSYYRIDGVGQSIWSNQGTERMRLDTSGNLGIGTSSPTAGFKLDVNGTVLAGAYSFGQTNRHLIYDVSATEIGIRIGTGGPYYGIGTTGSSNMRLNSASGGDMLFAIGGTERARINSSGDFLVGTTTGGRTVCIYSSDNWIRQSNASRSWLIGPSNDSTFKIYDETGGYTVAYFDTAGSFNLRNSIDMGSGVNLDNKIQIGAGRTGNNYAYIDLIGDTTFTDYGLRLLRGNTGANTTSQLIHRGTGTFTIGAQDAASVVFSTGNAERMRITSAGDVGIGTTTPNAPLAFGNAVATNGYDANKIRFYESGTSIFGIAIASAVLGYRAANHVFYTDSNSPSERMRINNSGNVGIGTSAPSDRLHVREDLDGTTGILVQNRNGTGTPVAAVQFISGAYDLSDNRYAMISSSGGSNTTLQFWTGSGATPTERMRVTDAGRVGIGTTAPTELLEVYGSSPYIAINNTAETDGGIKFYDAQGTTTQNATIAFNSSTNALRFYINNTERVTIDSSGNLTATGNVTAYSDARIKKDVETIDSALDLVSKMRGVRFTRIDNDTKGVGVIAQEMLEVLPEVVQQGVGDDGTLSVAYGNLVGVLIEAIKELRAEVAELKGK